mgnify:CR=1 FL=1
MDKKSNPTFEECVPIIEDLIKRRRYKWNLRAIAWMDYDDISQQILLHIWKKFSQFDISKGPIEKWVNRIISNQMSNLIRNHYGSHVRPCLQKCVFYGGGDECLSPLVESGKQCSECMLYAKWEKTKKRANNVKLPVSLEVHQQEVFDRPDESFDLENATIRLHKKMESILRPSEFRLYKLLYIEGKTEEQVAAELGYKSNEGRKAGYARIQQIKKIIWEVANKIKNDIDLF